MPNGTRTPLRQRITGVSDVSTALGIIADGVDDARAELLEKLGLLENEVSSTRRLQWTLLGTFLMILLAIAGLIVQLQ